MAARPKYQLRRSEHVARGDHQDRFFEPYRSVDDLLADLGTVVYFIYRDGYIKIGVTRNLKNRLKQLNARPVDVLAIIPGNEDIEHEMHERFSSLRVINRRILGKEHYWPGPELIAHINEIRDKMGIQPVVMAPKAT